MVDGKQMRIGIPKGSLEEATVKLFAKAGWKVTSHHRNYFPEINDPELTCSLCRAQEMARYVENGLLDAGLTGKDWILENQSDVVIAGRSGGQEDRHGIFELHQALFRRGGNPRRG